MESCWRPTATARRPTMVARASSIPKPVTHRIRTLASLENPIISPSSNEVRRYIARSVLSIGAMHSINVRSLTWITDAVGDKNGREPFHTKDDAAIDLGMLSAPPFGHMTLAS